jgi:S-adenosylmethionine-diacylglycerol 3-amino-3-carboxypropyl transferase
MRSNPIQFAVVREDPEIERAGVEISNAKRALLVASGGCTAFCLRVWRPDLAITLIDPNPAQLDLVRRKAALLGDTSLTPASVAGRRLYGIGQDFPESLTQCGNFESLFRQLRSLLFEFVATREEWERHFEAGGRDLERVDRFLANPYWGVAFESFFADAMLETMFTTAATRHAVKGSYPRYFRERFESGLRRPDAGNNYFLHHVLLGCYREDSSAWPEYLREPPRVDGFEYRNARLEEVADFSAYDLIALSNVMDWMDGGAIDLLATNLVRTANSGTIVIWRQLNNATDHERRLAPRFEFDSHRELAARLLAADRSLFYSSIHIGRRIPDPSR